MADRPILVTSYPAPDMDGFGGAWAYAELLNDQGTQAVARFFGPPRGEERYVMELFGGEYPATIPNDRDFEQVILVDASDRHGLEAILDPRKVVEIIDHRALHEAHEFSNAKVQIEPVGAAATLITERWHEFSARGHLRSGSALGDHFLEVKEGRMPTPLSVALLYGGIVSNTLNFRAAITTDRDQTMATWLRSLVDLPEDFVHQLFARKTALTERELHERFVGETGTRSFPDSTTSTYTQFELVDVLSFLARNEAALFAELAAIVSARQADYGWVSLLDLTAGTTTFLATDDRAKQLLSAVLGLSFSGHVAIYPTLILRKELHPKLKAYLERL